MIGHSGGGALAPAVMVRALELDPEIGRRGPPVTLLTLGSIAPGAALHPKAEKLRALFARLAVEPSVRWIDCQTRLDVMNFWDFDPVEGIGVHVGAERCNPLVWNLRLRDMLADEFVNRNRLNFFRLHYQFIMANDHRAPYDYFMLVCGPLPVATWARDTHEALAAFAADATLSIGATRRLIRCVMPGLVPGIHDLLIATNTSVAMARACPAMTRMGRRLEAITPRRAAR